MAIRTPAPLYSARPKPGQGGQPLLVHKACVLQVLNLINNSMVDL